MDALASHTTAVLDAEGVERADVWGYSRGSLLLVALMEHAGARVGSAVAGGVDLTALATGPASSERSTAVALLRAGDWPRFWEAFETDVPAGRRAEVERDNDPRALAAAMEAAGSISITVDPTTFHSMVYVGDGEPFAGTTAEIAGLLGLRCEVLPTGDHTATFDAAEVVCAAVVPFLDEA
jgi:pimeloyl-ACP methyl ester carboxylesterase